MSSRPLLALALVAVSLPARSRGAELNVITAVEVKDEGATVILSVKGSKRPSFTTFSMADPPRFVIDFSESKFAGVPEDMQVQDGTINVVKNLSYGSDATSIARVMIAFALEVGPPDVEDTGETLVVRIAKPNGATAPPAVAAAGDARAREADAARARDEAAAQAQAQARAEADRKAAAEAEQARAAQAQQQARAEEEARAVAAAEAKAADAAARARAEDAERLAAEARLRQTKARADAADAGAKLKDDESSAQEAEVEIAGAAPRGNAAAAEAARAEAARAEADAAQRARLEVEAAAQAQARAEAEERARASQAEAAQQARAEAARQAQAQAAQQAQQQDEAQAQAQARAAQQAQQQAEAQARAESAARAREDAARRAQEDADRQQAAADARQAQAAREAPAARGAEPQEPAVAPEPAPEPERAPPAYAGRLEAGAPAARLREVGFRQLPGVSRVFVRTSVQPRFTIQDAGENVIRVELENTRADRRNDLRFLDTSFFSSSVERVTPSRKGTTYVLEIKLKQKVPYQQKIEGDVLALDFERPANTASAAPLPGGSLEPAAAEEAPALEAEPEAQAVAAPAGR